jgi:ComF family protein
LLGHGCMGLGADLLELIFPAACAACAELLEGPGAFCRWCELATEPVPRPGCPQCGEPDGRGRRCGRCRARRPPFTSSFAAFLHEGPLARAIHRFKYEGHSELGVPLGQALARASGPWLAALPSPELVPIPLHVTRLRRRGYDQTGLLSQTLARVTRLPLRAQALQRTRATLRQVGLTEAQRTLNVAGAFQASPTVAGRTIVLVDDVVTTGATVRAAAEAVLCAGALAIHVLTLARAVGSAEPGAHPGADGPPNGL